MIHVVSLTPMNPTARDEYPFASNVSEVKSRPRALKTHTVHARCFNPAVHLLAAALAPVPSRASTDIKDFLHSCAAG